MAYYYHGVEYIPNERGVADKVKCPLTDDWGADIDCMENQGIIESSIPEEIIGESSSFLPISSRIEKLTLTSLLSNTIICFLGVVDLKSFFTKSKIIVLFHCNFQLSDVFQF